MSDTFIVSGGKQIQKTISLQGNPLSFVNTTVSSTSVALSSIPESAHAAVLQAQGGNIRYRLDGQAPDTSTGIILYNGSSLPLGNKAQIDGFRAIRDDSTDVTLAAQYYDIAQ